MSGVSEGIGTVIEGGLLSHAVEGEGGAGAAPPRDGAPTTCPNCQTRFVGHFCPECGQKAHFHRSLAAIGHDLVHGVLHLDGKLWNTLPLLTLRPGELTRRFIAGERAKFVSPMALFLFSVFAMFAVFQMVGVSVSDDFLEGWSNYGDPATNSAFRTNIQQQITALEQERAALPNASPRRAEIDNEITGLTNVLKAAGNAPIEIDLGNPDNAPTGIRFLDEGLIKKWNRNPGLMLYKLQANSYKFSWLLIPLSIPFLWLMFAWRREFKAYDHAVFVTYSLAFMSLLFIALSLLSLIPGGGDWAVLIFLIAVPLHLYKQLRHAYGLSRTSALWRFVVLLICTQIVLVLFLVIIGLLGAY
ncbi:MAG: hypothetical protein KatS3mg120_1000 [Erythrobacter sp.]|nr:MAG: hypothetical protein KatS3mg120_1000 [Erythrobacter sp.]